jgi:hypothetical protein
VHATERDQLGSDPEVVGAQPAFQEGDRLAEHRFGFGVPPLCGQLPRDQPHTLGDHGVLRSPRPPLRVQYLARERLGTHIVTALGRYRGESRQRADELREPLRRLLAQDA